MLKEGEERCYRLFHFRCRRETEDSFTAMKDATQTAYAQIRSSVPFDEANVTMPLLDETQRGQHRTNDDVVDGGVGQYSIGNVAASQI